MLDHEKVHHRFQLLRQLQGQGLAWEPSLLAPNDLVDKLGEEGLRFYAGTKLFDALYATTFAQSQAILDAVKTLESIQEKLNIHSFAAPEGKFLATLKKCASEAEPTKAGQYIDQLALDFSQDIPQMLSKPDSTTYLLDALYGFTIETGYVLAQSHKADRKGDGKIMKSVSQQNKAITDWLLALKKLFSAYDRLGETLEVKGKSVKKMALIDEILEHRQASETHHEKVKKTRESVYPKASDIREAMLSV